MRILLIAPHSFYIDRGTPIDVDILARALSNRGDTVDLVAYSGGEERTYPNLTIHRAETPSWIKNIGPGFSLKKLLADYWLSLKAYNLVKSQSYDVVHVGEEAVFIALWIKFRFKIPYIYDMDSSIAQQMVEKFRWLKPIAFIFNWCEAIAIRKALGTAPVCNALADLAKERSAQHITTLHDISQLELDKSKQPGRSIRSELGIKDEEVILMYVGNLETYQGIDLLVEAFQKAVAKLKSIHLVVAGGDPERIELYQNKTRDLNIEENVHYIGPWPAAQLGELLMQADILTAPRIKGINTPMKVFPYLHTGRAVLVTKLPTHTQILNNSVCYLAPAEAVGFSAAIVRLASDPEYRLNLGKAGKLFVEENHTFDAHQKRVNALYEYVATKLKI